MLKGNILARKDDKEYLERLGVIVGAYDPTEKQFVDCLVSDEAMEKLDVHWGSFFWSLHPIETYQ
jgi:hypothetical protein